jgi:hypothetical protein
LVNLKTNSAGDRYWEKAIEKTILRILGLCTFLHSVGQEDQFRPPSVSGRCAFAEETFARTHRKEEDAPKPALPESRQ